MKDAGLYQLLQEFSDEISVSTDEANFDKMYSIGQVNIYVKMVYGNKLVDDGTPIVTAEQHSQWDYEHAQRWGEVSDAVLHDDRMDKSVPPCFQGPLVYRNDDYELTTSEVKELRITGKTVEDQSIEKKLGAFNVNAAIVDKEIEDTLRAVFK